MENEMKTAEETAIELYRIANDVNVEYAQNTFQHMDVDEKKPWLRLAEYGMNKYELTESQSWVRASMESTAIAASTIAQLTRERDEARLLLNEDTRSVIVENDWLRKMVDAFADCSDCGDEWLMADYRDLPHVRARTAK